MTNARDFTVRLADLLRRERSAMSEFLVLLADFDRRRLWQDLGYASLFSFLHRELGLSKGAAHYRKTAAELVQRFPGVVEPLRDGRLCITSIVELAKVLSPENRDEVIPRFFHCSKREAAEVAAAIRPNEAPPRREVVTVPLRTAGPVALVQTVEPEMASRAEVVDAGQVAVQPVEPPHANFPTLPQKGRELTEPLTADLRRLHVTVSRRFVEKLEAARAALSHTHAAVSAEEILEAGLDLLLARGARNKGRVEKPLASSRPARSEHLPARVKREVWKRDGGRCQWPLESGGICGSTLRLEFDHVIPRARAGPSTIENTRLLCRFHNQLAARQIYGDEWMDRFTNGRAAPPSA
jgi:5-methylcytosine-specific restriction endonuclease McrA